MRYVRWLLLLSMTTLVQLAAFAAKPAPPPPPPSGDACVDKGGTFPAMAFARALTAKNGSYAGTQIYVANSLGTCQVMVYDSEDYSFPFSTGLSFHYDAGSGIGTLAWSQARDNGETSRNGRAVVKVAQFQVAAGAVVGAPLTATTVYRAASASVTISDVALSGDAIRLAFSTEQVTSTSGVYLYQVLTCNTMSCSAEVDFASTTDKALDLALGRNPANGEERIYFTYAHHDLAMIERDGSGGWSPPTVILSSGDYIESNVQLYEPAVLSVAGQEDRIVLTSRAGTGPWRVDLYDVATDALSSIGLGYGPSWTLSPSIDENAPNVLANGSSGPSVTSPFQEIDLDSGAETSLPAIGGYAVDSAY